MYAGDVPSFLPLAIEAYSVLCCSVFVVVQLYPCYPAKYQSDHRLPHP